MLYDITDEAIGRPCKQCRDPIEFAAFKVKKNVFCTIQCAFDYDKAHPTSDSSPEVMIHRSNVAYG